MPLDPANLPALPEAKQRAPKKDGVYIVGLNMAPGRWRSNGAGQKCYRAKSTAAQELIDNHYGAASVVVEIEPGVFQFEARGCGVWTMSEGVEAPAEPAEVERPAAAGSAACPNSNVCIVSPADGLVVSRGNGVAFTGTATHPAFARYQFLAGSNGVSGHIADFDKPVVVNGVLMEFHTDSIPPGTYTFRLQVIDQTGNAGPEKAEVRLTVR